MNSCKTCVICNKQFTPSKYTPNRQICCSKECSKSLNHMRRTQNYANNKDRFAMLRRQKQKIEGKIKCKLCGKPTWQVDTNYTRHFHEECVVNDAIDTITAGGKLTADQRNRLYSFGYAASDIKELVQERIEEIRLNTLTDDEYEELQSVMGYIIENHSDCKNWEMEEVIRYTVDTLLKEFIKEREKYE